MKNNMGKEVRRRKEQTEVSKKLQATSGLYSSKGAGGWFVILSIIGILVGLWMLSQGFGGKGLGSGTTLIIGTFMVIKEVMDIFFAG